MDKVRIKVGDNGSYKINGKVELLDAKGNVFKTSDEFYLCRCGKSKNMPFCDGTHKENFHSEPRAK